MTTFLLQSPLVFGQTTSLIDESLLGIFFKVLFILAALLYATFAFVMTRQIKIMRSTLVTTFSPLLKTVGFVHLAAALILLVGFVLFL